MNPAPVYLASDVHLGAAPPEHEEAFLQWLASLPGRAGSVVLNGDIFDFWFEYARGVTRGHDRALEVLRSVVDAGVAVTLLGGNHDWWGGRFLREEVGIEFLQEPTTRVLAGRTAFVAHGDGVGPGDRGYHLLRWILRGRLTRFAYRRLPPAVGDAVARRVSSTRDRWSGPTEGDRASAAALGDWAASLLSRRRELDLVVLGHTHVPALREVEPGRWYLNLGDWVYHRSWAVLEEGQPPRLIRGVDGATAGP